MQLDQIILESTSQSAVVGHRVIACSTKFDETLIDQIQQICPGHGDLMLGCDESFIFLEIGNQKFIAGRSCIGPTDRGSNGVRQVISRMVVIDRNQMSGYQSNAALLLQVLNSLGVLHFTSTFSRELPPAEVPDLTFLPPRSYGTMEPEQEFERLRHAIEIHQRVAIVGLDDPLDYACGMLSQFPEETRLSFSFGVGLTIAEHRPFTMQFFRDSDPHLIRELASHQLRTISFAPSLANA